jgi:hypothetical protein
MRILEILDRTWNVHDLLVRGIDESGERVSEYLSSQGIEWRLGDLDDIRSAEALLFKGAMIYPPGPRNVTRSVHLELMKRISNKPYVTLFGEPREYCWLSYDLCDPAKAFSVAPGKRMNRIFFPSYWADPEVESWEKREDRICWIGRPMGSRIRAAKKLIEEGIELDIYSKRPWPLEQWRGFALDEMEISRQYRYRIVFENEWTNKYHSEKLFNSIKYGCVTFYGSDASLDLPQLKGAYSPYSLENVIRRDELAPSILSNIKQFMFSDSWKMYSMKTFFDALINKLKEDARERKA